MLTSMITGPWATFPGLHGDAATCVHCYFEAYGLHTSQMLSEAKWLTLLVLLLPVQNRDDPKKAPPEDNIESACEMITVTGKMLAAADNKKTRDALEGYLARLQRLGEDRTLSSRVKFLVSCGMRSTVCSLLHTDDTWQDSCYIAASSADCG